MTMIVPGRTKCPLCGRVMEKGEPLTGFPAFLPQGHDLAAFSDSILHQACVEAYPRGRRALALRDRFEKVLRSVPRKMSRIEGEAWFVRAIDGLWNEDGFKVGPATQPPL